MTPAKTAQKTPSIRARFGRFVRRRKAFFRLTSRQDKGPVTERTLRLIGKLEAAGKWMASVSGVAIGLGVGLMITAYGSVIPNFNVCITRYAAAQSIHRGVQLAEFFAWCGLFGLLAGILPNMLAVIELILRFVTRRSQPSHTAGRDLFWMREGHAGTLVAAQTILLSLSGGIFVVGLAYVIYIASQQTPENLLRFYSVLLVECGAPPPP
jgi:hypothetical protein